MDVLQSFLLQFCVWKILLAFEKESSNLKLSNVFGWACRALPINFQRWRSSPKVWNPKPFAPFSVIITPWVFPNQSFNSKVSKLKTFKLKVAIFRTFPSFGIQAQVPNLLFELISSKHSYDNLIWFLFIFEIHMLSLEGRTSSVLIIQIIQRFLRSPEQLPTGHLLQVSPVKLTWLSLKLELSLGVLTSYSL